MTTKSLGLSISAQMEATAGRVQRSLVRITNGGTGGGAGTVIHPQGLILTNAHVVPNERVRVDVSGEVFQGRLLARDRALDLATIVVEGHDLSAAPLGDSDDLLPGEVVFSLGFPWGVEGGLTFGVVIQVGALPEMALRTGRPMLSASLHLRPGHSGGPMFDCRGTVVGLNTIMQGPAVGVAVPVNQAKRFLKESMAALA